MPDQANPPSDPALLLLRQYVLEKAPERAEQYLEQLLAQYAIPLIHKVIHAKLTFGGRRSRELQNENDLCQDVVLQIVRRLQALRVSQDSVAVFNFEGYVVTCAQNAYSNHVRSKNPRRWRLKNRIRYFLNHQAEVEQWTVGRANELVCGFPGWQRGVAVDAKHIPCSWEEFAAANRSIISQSHKDLAPLIAAVLEWQGKPVRVEELVGIVAELTGVRDLQQVESVGEDDAAFCELLPARAPDPSSQLIEKLHLERLWVEICQLPRNQRVALLLNLRDGSNDALILFTLMGITSMRAISQVLEIEMDAFTALWNELPMDDNAIAAFLRVTRQQVINFRKSAKERLNRRTG